VEVRADPLRVPRVGRRPIGRRHEQRRRQPELAADVVRDAHGNIVDEAAKSAQGA
jgi:hypothetical protein